MCTICCLNVVVFYSIIFQELYIINGFVVTFKITKVPAVGRAVLAFSKIVAVLRLKMVLGRPHMLKY